MKRQWCPSSLPQASQFTAKHVSLNAQLSNLQEQAQAILLSQSRLGQGEDSRNRNQLFPILSYNEELRE
jgi:hypothetical protein